MNAIPQNDVDKSNTEIEVLTLENTGILNAEIEGAHPSTNTSPSKVSRAGRDSVVCVREG
jgi:hypothetical protein